MDSIYQMCKEITARNKGPLRSISLMPERDDIAQQAARHYGLRPTPDVCKSLRQLAQEEA